MSQQNDFLIYINFIDPTDRSQPVVDQLETGVTLEGLVIGVYQWETGVTLEGLVIGVNQWETGVTLVIGVTCSHSRVTQDWSDSL